jgi:hypothetical protein
MPQMGGGQLDAVVAAQGERLGIDTSFFDQGLADLGDREPRPGQDCSTMERAWANSAWLAPLKRACWANAAIDSAQVILQTAMPAVEQHALIMVSLPGSSMKSLSRAEVSQNRITVPHHDPRSRCH